MVIIYILITIIFLIGLVSVRKMILSNQCSDIIVSSLFLVAAWIMLSILIGLFLLFDDLEASKEAVRAIEHRIKTAALLMTSGFVLFYFLFLLLKKLSSSVRK
jgi:hypothetical protein